MKTEAIIILVQYWWHRASHVVPRLYNLHRPDHNVPYLSIRVVYRNNFSII